MIARNSTYDPAREEASLDRLLDDIEFQADRSELIPARRRARRQQVLPHTPEAERAFCKIYFPQIFALPFNDVHHHLSNLGEGHHTVSGFRQSGKSAYCYVGKAIRRIVLSEEDPAYQGIVNVNLRTLDKAKARTVLLSRMIQHSELLQYDFAPTVHQDKAGYHIIGAAHLIAGSYQTGLRAYIDEGFKRFRLSINDDLYDRQSVDSERDNEKVANFVLSEVRGQMEEGGLDITLGNSITAGAPIVRLKKQHPEGHFSLPALDEEGETTWPAYRSRQEWLDFKATTPLDIWMGEYQDQPMQRGETFEEEWLDTIRLSLITITTSITVLDPAHGESPHACYKGLATLGLESEHGDPVALDLWGRRAPYDEVFDHCAQLRRRFGAHHKAILVEDDFSQWGHAQPYYQTWLGGRGEPLPLVRFLASEMATTYRSAEKDSRILGLVHPHRTGQFKYLSRLKGSAHWELFRRQYLAFPKGDTLDILDALASAYILIRRYRDTETFKPAGKRKMSRPSFTGTFH